MFSDKKGFMLMEIIIAFLIVSISVGIVFQNLSLSLSLLDKGKESLNRAFALEKAGMLLLLEKELSREDLPLFRAYASYKDYPFEIGETQCKLTEITLEYHNKKSRICLFSLNTP